jgi:ubiquitin-small subunit ribosomal protein S27Ae
LINQLQKAFNKTNMQIFVGSTAYEVDPATSVESLKLMIENAEFVPSQQIELISGARTLEGGSLEGNGVEEDDTIQMRLAVNAGMRNKWRKKRMRRLRRKRRKMRQRAK